MTTRARSAARAARSRLQHHGAVATDRRDDVLLVVEVEACRVDRTEMPFRRCTCATTVSSFRAPPRLASSEPPPRPPARCRARHLAARRPTRPAATALRLGAVVLALPAAAGEGAPSWSSSAAAASEWTLSADIPATPSMVLVEAVYSGAEAADATRPSGSAVCFRFCTSCRSAGSGRPPRPAPPAPRAPAGNCIKVRPARLGGSGTPQESVVCLPGTTYSPTKFYPTTESDCIPLCPLPQRSRSTIQADACGLRDGGRRERP